MTLTHAAHLLETHRFKAPGAQHSLGYAVRSVAKGEEYYFP